MGVVSICYTKLYRYDQRQNSDNDKASQQYVTTIRKNTGWLHFWFSIINNFSEFFKLNIRNKPPTIF